MVQRKCESRSQVRAGTGADGNELLSLLRDVFFPAVEQRFNQRLDRFKTPALGRMAQQRSGKVVGAICVAIDLPPLPGKIGLCSQLQPVQAKQQSGQEVVAAGRESSAESPEHGRHAFKIASAQPLNTSTETMSESAFERSHEVFVAE